MGQEQCLLRREGDMRATFCTTVAGEEDLASLGKVWHYRGGLLLQGTGGP